MRSGAPPRWTPAEPKVAFSLGGEIRRPCGDVASALAVVKSNSVGACTGRSPGFAPRRMRST
jgi:hypothetical protein